MNAMASRWLANIGNHALFVGGVFFGVSLFMIADIQLSLLAIERSPSETMPNMHPSIRYLFVPVVVFIIAIAGALLNVAIGWFHKHSLPQKAWLPLGFSYSCAASFFPLGHMFGQSVLSLFVAVVFTIAVVAYTRIFYSKRAGANDA